jgi:predicted dehydrogenase
MRQVKWGVIGAGGIATRRTIPGVTEFAKIGKFVALMDVRKEAAEEAAKRFGVPKAYGSEAELLADPEVQAVYVATPVHFHLSHILAAAKAGKHVLCEKPLTMDVAEAEQAVAACRKAGVLVGCAFMMQFHQLNAAARHLVARGELGKVVAGRAQLVCWYPPIPGAWRQVQKTGGGGALYDLTSHCIDLLEFISGSRVKSVSAIIQTLVHSYEVDDSSTVIMKMENGAQMIADGFFCVPDTASRSLLEMYGTTGAFYGQGTLSQVAGGKIEVVLSNQASYDPQQNEKQSDRTFELKAEPVNMYAAEIDQLSQAILDGGKPFCDGEDALWNMKILAACLRSAREKREIDVK